MADPIRRGAAAAMRTRPDGSDRGATAVEYGIVVMLITAVIVLAVSLLGGATGDDLECTRDSIAARGPAC